MPHRSNGYNKPNLLCGIFIRNPGIEKKDCFSKRTIVSLIGRLEYVLNDKANSESNKFATIWLVYRKDEVYGYGIRKKI